MIGYLEGTLSMSIVIVVYFVNGIGYEILIHAKTASLTMGAQQFSLHPSSYREDGQSLLGFDNS